MPLKIVVAFSVFIIKCLNAINNQAEPERWTKAFAYRIKMGLRSDLQCPKPVKGKGVNHDYVIECQKHNCI